MYTRSHAITKLAVRAYSQTSSGAVKPSGVVRPSAPAPAVGINANVPGLSSQCVKPVQGPVGPGAAPNAEYKVPEYFCFNRFSFAEAEVEMAKFRCPQPSALQK